MTRYMYGLPPAPDNARMQPVLVAQKPFASMPGHPYVTFRTGYDEMGQFWVDCRCHQCGTAWKKPCMRPARANLHVLRFATIHGHGLSPQRR